MTVTLDISPEMAQKIADIAAGQETNADAMRRTFAELAVQMPNWDKQAPRIAGLGRGDILWISDDFDDPLPDSFWFGEDEEDAAKP